MAFAPVAYVDRQTKEFVTQIIDDSSTRVDPFILLQQVPRNASRIFGIRARFGL